MAPELREGGTPARGLISSDQALTERLRCGTPRTSAEVGSTRSSGASTVQGKRGRAAGAEPPKYTG
jgi:hypothetical protein